MRQTISAEALLHRIRLRQVALLLELQARGTLRAAASELGMTQPAATNMLKELEASLDLKLFEREGRRLRPTPVGTAVLAHFGSLKGALSALARDLEDLRAGEGGTLAIGSILAPSPTYLTRAVAQLKSEQPRLRISLLTETSDHLLDLLDQGKLDVMVGRLAEGHAQQDYLTQVLEDEPLSVVVGPNHPLANVRQLSLSELVAQPWVLQPRHSPMREALEQEFRLQRLDRPQNLVETASILTTIFLIGEAPMVAVVPASLASSYAAKHLLRVLPVHLSNQLEPYGSIVRRGRPLSPATRRFLDLLHQPHTTRQLALAPEA